MGAYDGAATNVSGKACVFSLPPSFDSTISSLCGAAWSKEKKKQHKDA
jgi:hypothetical protein